MSTAINDQDVSSINVLPTHVEDWVSHMAKDPTLLHVALDERHIVMWIPVKERIPPTHHEAFLALLSSDVSRMSSLCGMDVRLRTTSLTDIARKAEDDYCCGCTSSSRAYKNGLSVSFEGKSAVAFWAAVATKIITGVVETRDLMFRSIRDHVLRTAPSMRQRVTVPISTGKHALPFGHAHSTFASNLETEMNAMFRGEGVCLRNTSVERRLTEKFKRDFARKKVEILKMSPLMSCMFPIGIVALLLICVPELQRGSRHIASEKNRLSVCFELNPVPV